MTARLQVYACPGCNQNIFHDGSIAGLTVSCPHCGVACSIPRDLRQHNDAQRTLSDAALDFECILYGQAPVQAEGHVAGCQLYFRAKWDHWTFVVSLDADGDPASMNPVSDEDGFFEDGGRRGFYLSGDVPGAGYLRYDAAEALIRECIRRFVQARQTELREPQ